MYLLRIVYYYLSKWRRSGRKWGWPIQKSINVIVYMRSTYRSVYIQYAYIVCKYKIHLYKLQKQAEQRAFIELFMPVSQRVQMSFIFNDNERILCLSCNVKKVGKLVRFRQKDRNKRHSSPFINVVKGVFFVVRVTLEPVSYLSTPSDVHSYRVPGKLIRRLKSLLVQYEQFIRLVRTVYSSSTNKAKIYSHSIFVQQMY